MLQLLRRFFAGLADSRRRRPYRRLKRHYDQAFWAMYAAGYWYPDMAPEIPHLHWWQWQERRKAHQRAVYLARQMKAAMDRIETGGERSYQRWADERRQ